MTGRWIEVGQEERLRRTKIERASRKATADIKMCVLYHIMRISHSVREPWVFGHGLYAGMTDSSEPVGSSKNQRLHNKHNMVKFTPPGRGGAHFAVCSELGTHTVTSDCRQSVTTCYLISSLRMKVQVVAKTLDTYCWFVIRAMWFLLLL